LQACCGSDHRFYQYGKTRQGFSRGQFERLFVVLIKATIGFDHLKQNTITQFAGNGFSIISILRENTPTHYDNLLVNFTNYVLMSARI
jgi:hypothetical protein